MLTRKQHELLRYINDYLAENGVSPSFDEMKDALALKSKSGIHRLITALEERGFIRRLPHRARALEVLKLPEGAVARTTAPEPGFSASVIRGNFAAKTADSTAARGSESLSLPLYGRIAAGTPIEALRDQSNSVDVPASLLGRGEYYALEVAGDSMVDAGIFDGDTIIIERGDVAENGTIVVALIDNEEVTLKRLRRKGNSVALEAANETYETRIFGPDRVKVQGRLVSLLRQY
ncbi:MAG: transcriptional repressor LexA [Alphaproteobacteria bacterium]|nr:transcriptional repressor LexA [Alphaproteobacteria bacterium]MCY4498869.1 transcriptional repressor LexA [Rhodospirillaceae bacterium]